MGKDYYSIIGVPFKAPESEISKKFRALALAYHPKKNVHSMAKSNYNFSEICEAYEVLSNPALRDIYDKYGEEMLKSGLPDQKGQIIGGYKFSGNSLEIFEKFFGTANPFTIQFDENGN